MTACIVIATSIAINTMSMIVHISVSLCFMGGVSTRFCWFLIYVFFLIVLRKEPRPRLYMLLPG